MNIRFDKNHYLSCVTEERRFKSGFWEDSLIIKYAKHHPQFSFGNVSYKKFSEKEFTPNWKGRKILALPSAIWSLTVKVVYHLCLAIFIGIPKCFISNGSFFRGKLFCAARDFQEGYGYLASLVNAKYGAYHVQESNFHKTSYECFSPLFTKVTFHEELSWEYQHYIRYPSLADSKFISLYEFKNESIKNREKFVKEFQINDCIAAIEKKVGLDFNTFLQKTDNETLKNLTLLDVLVPIKDSKIKFALMETEKFESLRLDEIESTINREQIAFIVTRLEQSAKKDSNPIKDPTLLKNIMSLTTEEIHLHHEKISPIGFAFLTYEQLKTLKISLLNKFQIDAIFNSYEIREKQEKLATLDPNEVIEAIHKGVLAGWTLSYLSETHTDKLSLSRLSKEQIKEIYHETSNGYKDVNLEKNILRFAKFPPDTVKVAIEQNKLDGYALRLLSDEQLKALKIFKLLNTQIKAIFEGFQDRKKERFALFNPEDVKAALENGVLRDGLLLDLISEEQLKKIKLSTLSRETISEMFRDGDSWTFFVLNNYERKYYKFNKARFALFDADDVHEALKKGLLNIYIINLFSEEHLKYRPLSPENKKKVFAALELDISATQAEIKKAFHRLALKYHPDKIRRADGENDEEYKKREADYIEKFKDINNAYTALTNLNK